MSSISEQSVPAVALASPEAQNGPFFAFVNAFNHERSNHTIRTAHALGEVLQRGVIHSQRFLESVVSKHDHRTWPSEAAANAAHVRSASITRSTSDGLGRFLNGFWACPNGSQFAAIASDAGDHLRKVVSVNGQLALSGVNLDKQRRARLPDEQIKSMFSDMDRNGNGYIDADEFQLLIQHLGLPASDAFRRDAMSKFSDCDDGVLRKVSYNQFCSYFDHSTDKLWQAFESLDDQSNGLITEGSLLRSLRDMGMSAQPEDARRMIRLLDRNCDDAITFEEFCRFACMLPRNQIENNNVAFCWVDSADFMDGHAFRLNMVPSKQPWQRLMGGAFAGAASRTLVAPLERLRTIAMASPNAMAPSRVVSVALRDGGLSGLFRGNTATLVKIMPASAVQFTVYEALRDALKACGVFGSAGVAAGGPKRGAGPEHFVAGFTAGAAQCLVSHPLETIRTLMSVPGCTQGNFFQAARQAIHQYGVRGLYAGLKPSLVGDMIGTGLGFFAYEKANGVFEHVTGRQPQALEKGFVGAASATIVMTGTMPLELIQRRMQVARTSAGTAFRYAGLQDAFVTIMREEGFAAFFRGSAFSYLKIPISIGAMYALYEVAGNVMAWDGLRSYQRGEAEIDQQQARLQRQRARLGVDSARTAQIDRNFGELVEVTRPVSPGVGSGSNAAAAP
eukprot:jgi/Ulvmu1/10843/UM007_0017.1